jgi:hypothetical protein
MGRWPDSPEGIAFAMAMMILGYSDVLTSGPISKERLFRTYRECITTIREDPTRPEEEGFGDQLH